MSDSTLSHKTALLGSLSQTHFVAYTTHTHTHTYTHTLITGTHSPLFIDKSCKINEDDGYSTSQSNSFFRPCSGGIYMNWELSQASLYLKKQMYYIHIDMYPNRISNVSKFDHARI